MISCTLLQSQLIWKSTDGSHCAPDCAYTHPTAAVSPMSISGLAFIIACQYAVSSACSLVVCMTIELLSQLNHHSIAHLECDGCLLSEASELRPANCCAMPLQPYALDASSCRSSLTLLGCSDAPLSPKGPEHRASLQLLHLAAVLGVVAGQSDNVCCLESDTCVSDVKGWHNGSHHV